MSAKGVTLGCLTGVAVLLICCGIVYWETLPSSNSFAENAVLTGHKVVEDIGNIQDTFKNVSDTFVAFGNDLVNMFNGNFDKTVIGVALINGWQNIIVNVQSFFLDLGKGLSDGLNSLGKAISDTYNTVGNWFVNLFNWGWHTGGII